MLGAASFMKLKSSRTLPALTNRLLRTSVPFIASDTAPAIKFAMESGGQYDLTFLSKMRWRVASVATMRTKREVRRADKSGQRGSIQSSFTSTRRDLFTCGFLPGGRGF